MGMTKRGQAQIITTVLIILLVLAAIVIVWQVVRTTVETGAGEVEAQSSCMGVDITVTNTNPGTDTIFIAKREASGGTFTASDLVVIVDGTRLTSGYSMIPASNPLLDPLDTVTVTLTSAATTSVEIGLIGDGTTCPGTGEVEI